jgi:hypothetical protein
MKFFKIFLFLMFFGISYLSKSQCRTFSKKECMPQLLPFIHNGQMNNVTLFDGESAYFQQTFYSGQDYRTVVCVQEILGDDAYFEVFSTDKKLLYSNKESAEFVWDFSVGSTQNLIFKVSIPESTESKSDMEHNGCVSVIIGFGDD